MSPCRNMALARTLASTVATLMPARNYAMTPISFEGLIRPLSGESQMSKTLARTIPALIRPLLECDRAGLWGLQR